MNICIWRLKLSYVKRLFLVVFLLVLASFIFATTYTIDNYKFVFNGNTDASVAYSKLQLEDYTSFGSYEDLKKYVKAKEQEIANWNIFNQTSSTIEEITTSAANISTAANTSAPDEKHYTAIFTINDNLPIIAYPIPSYDTNTGLSLGVAASSENFLGKLSHFFTKFMVEQRDRSFEKSYCFFELLIDRFPIANFFLDTNVTFEYKALTQDLTLYSRTTLSNIKIGEAATFRFQAGFALKASESQTLGFDNFFYTATFANIFESLGGFTFTQNLTYKPATQEVKTSSALSYFGIKLRDQTVTLNLEIITLNASKTDNFIDITMKEAITIPYEFPLDILFSPSFVFTNPFTKNTEKTFTASVSLTRSGVNKYIDGNQDFKKGISFSLFITRTMPIDDWSDESSQYAKLSVTYFPYANDWINPAVRISGIFSKNPVNNLTTDSPEGSNPATFVTYLRGIIDDSKYNKALWNSIFIANLSLTTKLVEVGTWAKVYVVPFADIAFLAQKEGTSHWLCTIGIETLGLLNDLANFPLRVSVGFNTESFASSNLEYEIFVGIGFFY